MKERSIIFTGASPKYLLGGSKTQTSRILKLPKWSTEAWEDFDLDDHGNPIAISYSTGCFAEIRSRYGQAGDRLWVKEPFWIEHDQDIHNDRPIDCGINLAEGEGAKVWYCSTDDDPGPAPGFYYSKHSPIFMPRWASRMSIENAGTRVKRLKDLTLDEIKAEGASPLEWCEFDNHSYAIAWKRYWESINGNHSFQKNPWVWVVKFKVI